MLPGQKITVEDLHNACAMTYPAAYRSTMTGSTLKDILEDVADNLFNTDPYYQQGGDMVRVGGHGLHASTRTAAMGGRISDMTLLKSGEAIEPAKDYVVAGWASVNEATEGPPIWEVVEDYLGEEPCRDARGKPLGHDRGVVVGPLPLDRRRSGLIHMKI